MGFCPQCGFEKADEAVFCSKCGFRFQNKSLEGYEAGLTAFKSGDYAEAVTTLSAYLKENSGDADAWNVKGVALAKIGKYQAAIYCYDKALALQPGNEKFAKNRAIVAKKIHVEFTMEESYPVQSSSVVRAPNPHVQGLKNIAKALLIIIIVGILASAIAAFVFGMNGGQTEPKKEVINREVVPVYITVYATEPKPTYQTANQNSNIYALSGNGQQATKLFYLDPGLVRFKLNHVGSRNFIVWLLDSKGNKIDLLVNEIGNFDGSKAEKIKTSGNYLLDIQADGSWMVLIQN